MYEKYKSKQHGLADRQSVPQFTAAINGHHALTCWKVATCKLHSWQQIYHTLEFRLDGTKIDGKITPNSAIL